MKDAEAQLARRQLAYHSPQATGVDTGGGAKVILKGWLCYID